MYEYLASVQSAVRRVNDRIKTLSEKFGVNSSIVKQATAKIDVLMSDNYRFSNGVIQISKPSDIYGDEEKMQALKTLEDNIETWGYYRKAYQEQYTKYTEEQEFFKNDYVEFSDFVLTMENLQNALREIASEQLPEDALQILSVKGRKNTYTELNQVTKILSEKGFI